MKKALLAVRCLSASSRRGILQLGPFRWPCALGRSGLCVRKREGDGATPRGRLPIIKAYYRPDKFARLPGAVALEVITPRAGWCDAPCDRNYNRAVQLPYPASCETLWRVDDVYDALIVLDYNLRPRVKGRGSAIFLHIARQGYPPTEGCVAISKRDLRLLLSRLPRGAVLTIP